MEQLCISLAGLIDLIVNNWMVLTLIILLSFSKCGRVVVIIGLVNMILFGKIKFWFTFIFVFLSIIWFCIYCYNASTVEKIITEDNQNNDPDNYN